MAKEIATYSASITIRSDDEAAAPLKITDIEEAISAAIEYEYENGSQKRVVVVNVSASRDDI